MFSANMLCRNIVLFTVCFIITVSAVVENQEMITDQSNDIRQVRNFEVGHSPDQRLLKLLASTGTAFAPPVDEDSTLEPQGAPRPPINIQDANYMSAVASLPQRGGLSGPPALLLSNSRQLSNPELSPQIVEENSDRRAVGVSPRTLHLEGMQKEAMIKEMMFRAMQQHQGRFFPPGYPPINGQSIPNMPPRTPVMGQFPRHMQNVGPAQIPPVFNSPPRQYQLSDQIDSGDFVNPLFFNVNPRRSQQILGAPTPIQIGEVLGYPSGASFSPLPFNSNFNPWEAEGALLQWKNGQGYPSSAAPFVWNSRPDVVDQAFSEPSVGNLDQKEDHSTPSPQPVNISIVAFTKSSCGQICVELEKIFKNYHNLSADFFEVEKMPVDGQEALLSLYQKSGIKVMPQVYVCNKFVGGVDKVRHLHKTKKLDDIVKRCS